MGGVSSDGVAIRSEDRSVVWVERIDGCGDGTYRTTDEQWQSIVDCIAAAPEMLATLRDLSREIRAGSILDAGSIGDWGRYIDEVIAKAEPPRKVKHTVHVTVQVEVETTPCSASDPGNVCMAAVDAVRDGEGTVIHHEIVTERTRGVPGRC
jgi:hypothetical protein